MSGVLARIKFITAIVMKPAEPLSHWPELLQMLDLANEFERKTRTYPHANFGEMIGL